MNTLYNKDTMHNNFLDFGYEIVGRNNKKIYIVQKLLGVGENGCVYLVKQSNKLYALKMSKASTNIDYEIYIINKISEPQERYLEVSIIDADECIINRKSYSFYIMPYHIGKSIDEYLIGKSPAEFLKIFKKTIEYLSFIHNKGWVFGDIKPEHIIISETNKSINFIDFGGVTKINEGVKQFSEIYDRGSWRVGNRRADQHYDLFSVAMVFIQIAIGKIGFSKLYNQKLKIKKVCDIIRNVNVLLYIFPIIKMILLGQLTSTYEVLYKIHKLTEPSDKRSGKFGWIHWLFTSSLILFIVIVLIFIYGGSPNG